MSGNPLSFGAMLMSVLRKDDVMPGLPRFTKAVELAEELKFDAVWTGSSYALGGPDAFAMLGHAASITQDLHFGTSVFLLPMRHPTTTALEVAASSSAWAWAVNAVPTSPSTASLRRTAVR
jgi:alkanesulfonate monooxygenase SsuD/methylene tetrahydromethanopterin reductase-like flavin-dependent oxidoreductase (luciferase family)